MADEDASGEIRPEEQQEPRQRHHHRPGHRQQPGLNARWRPSDAAALRRPRTRLPPVFAVQQQHAVLQNAQQQQQLMPGTFQTSHLSSASRLSGSAPASFPSIPSLTMQPATSQPAFLNGQTPQITSAADWIAAPRASTSRNGVNNLDPSQMTVRPDWIFRPRVPMEMEDDEGDDADVSRGRMYIPDDSDSDVSDGNDEVVHRGRERL
jgi:hypothetical protein